MIDLKKLFTMFVVLSFVMVFGFAFAANAYSAEKAAAASEPAPASASVKSDKININTADVDQLVKLPRIGEKMANRIIDYRKQNGKFKKIQDLMKVKGIGEKTFKRFENMLTL